MAQMHLLNIPASGRDSVHTPIWVAKDVVDYFKPIGLCLDPCKGNGEFFDLLPEGSEWCEIKRGVDFFKWDKKVDWIVSNPPYSVFSQWLQHSFNVADNIVYVIPINKPFNSMSLMKKIYKYGGIKEIRVISGGSKLNWDIGFAIGAVYFKRDYNGDIKMSFANHV